MAKRDLWSILGLRESESQAPVSPTPDPTLATVLAEHDLVEVLDNGVLVVAPKKLSQDAPTGEIGTSTPAGWGRGEYNRTLTGRMGLQKYEQMRRSDGTVKGTMRLVKTPVLSARWFIEPASDSTRDENAAEFVWKVLTEYQSIDWPQVLTEALLMVDFGYYMFELIWENRVIDGQTRTVLKKLAPRHPMDVRNWTYDRNGGVNGVIMEPHPDDETHLPKYIPIEKLLVFTNDREAGDMTGISVLRSAYKHWYYKEQLYKIDAIQKERHGIGVPIIKLPMGFNSKDVAAAHLIGNNLRTNESAHVVLPPNWEIVFAKLEGAPVDIMKSIDHHDTLIEKNILAMFMGEKGAKVEDQTMFLKATRYLADIIVAVFNAHLIDKIMMYNFDRVKTPKLRVRRIGETEDQRTMTFAIRNLVGAGVLRPDAVLEAWVRDYMDLPEIDEATRDDYDKDLKKMKHQEQVAKEQAKAAEAAAAAQPEGTPGKPDQVTRQTPPSATPPRPNGGTDRSGG